MHIYTAVQRSENGSFDLEKDGQGCFCPKTAVVLPQQSQIQGQMAMVPVKFPCSTSCPFAIIAKRKIPFFDAEGNGSMSKEPQDAYIIACESDRQIILPLNEIKKHSKIASPLSVR